MKKASIREVVAPPLFDLVPMLRGRWGRGVGEVGKQGWRSGKSTQLPPESFAVQVPASKSYVGRVWV